MEIIKADIGDADVVGYIHSTAWKQAYTDVFAEEYLNGDTPEKRTQEYLEACNNKDIYYYMIYECEKAVGIVKVIVSYDGCEISSFYILEEYRSKGYGKQTITYIKKIFDRMKIQLWVLADNKKARCFYENNGFRNTGKTRMIYRGNSYVQLQYELLPEVWAYEMYYDKKMCETSSIMCLSFKEEYFAEYMCVYNECFYDMRKALEIEPYNWYSKYVQMADKAENVFIFLKDNQIIGSVACYGNEIDDLIVKKSYQKKGYGKQLLLWAMNHIRQNNDSEITLHVAEWNEGALELYKKVGFLVRKKEKVR